MNVVILSDGGQISGGAEKVALTTAIGLSQAGVGVAVLAGFGPVDPSFASHPDIDIRCLGQEDAYKSSDKLAAVRRLIWNQDAARELSDMLRKFSPEDTVVHVHGFRRVLSSSVVKVAGDLGFPMVLTLHDFGIACPNTAYYNYKTEVPCTLKPMTTACLLSQCTQGGIAVKGAMVARQAALKYQARVPERIRDYIAVSEFSAKILRPMLPPAASVEVLHNPDDAIRQAPAPVGESDTFLYVGRLVPEKAPVLAVLAAKQIGAKIAFAGVGPEEPNIREANPDAELLGWLTPEQLREQMMRSRALVFPSRWYETAGLAVMDALANGLPAIVSDTSAATEFIQDGVNGLRFRSGDASDLAEKMQVMQDRATCERMAAAAYEFAWREPRTMETHVAKLKEIYDRVLSAASRIA